MTVAPRLARAAPSSGVFWILVVLVVLIGAFAAILPADTFVSTFNAQTVAGDASIILILAAGANTLVIISGGLDLSIGSVMTFSAVVSALVMKDVGGDWVGWARRCSESERASCQARHGAPSTVP